VKTKSIVYSAVTLIGAIWMYRFLNSGGWLTHHYQLNQLNDPDSLNLIPVIFEPIAVLGVVATGSGERESFTGSFSFFSSASS